MAAPDREPSRLPPPLFKIARVLDAVDPTRARRSGGVYTRSCSAGRRRPVGTVKIVGPGGSGTLRGYILRRVAERGRQPAIAALTRHMIAAKGKPEERLLADQLDVMIREIADLREGAFGPLFRQEFVRAALVPLSGAGGIALLEYVILGR